MLKNSVQTVRYIDSLCSLATHTYEIEGHPQLVFKLSWYMGTDVRPLTCISICWACHKQSLAPQSRFLPSLRDFDDRVPSFEECNAIVMEVLGRATSFRSKIETASP